MAHQARCATESWISVAHMARCATESQGGDKLKFEKKNSVAHQPGAPQKVDILWRTKGGAPQNFGFSDPTPLVDRLFSLAEKKRK